MTALLNWRVWAAAAVAATLFLTHAKAYRMGGVPVQAQCDAERAQVAATTLAVTQAARAKEQDLQTKADTLRKAKNAEIAKLGTDLARAIDGLRDRPARPGAGGVSGDTSAGAGCTGASLYASDAEFLVRESARADRLRLDLGQCQQAYQAARDAVK